MCDDAVAVSLFDDFPASLKRTVHTALQFKTHSSAKHTVLHIYSEINRQPSVLSGILTGSHCTCTHSRETHLTISESSFISTGVWTP